MTEPEGYKRTFTSELDALMQCLVYLRGVILTDEGMTPETRIVLEANFARVDRLRERLNGTDD